MHEVNTISLNGNAWQIESEGCEALAAYLKIAETRLAGDPDRDEILADLEQAIADKLACRISAHKNVVTTEEIKVALIAMGPVETGAAADAAAAGAPDSAETSQHAHAAPNAEATGAQDTQAPGFNPKAGVAGATRHLFRIREGGMVSGVCNGLAAYFGLDVTVVRLIFVLTSVFTGGVGVAVYLVMIFVVPVAVTAEQMAAAHGKPFSAEELIGRPQGPQAAYSASNHWRQQWRDQRRVWREERRQWRQQRRSWSAFGPHPAAPPPPGWNGAPYPGHFGPPPYVGGPMFGLLRVVLLIVFLTALFGAIAGRPLLGWNWTAVVPHWVGIIAVCMIWGTLAGQMNMARHFGYAGAYHPGHALFTLISTLIWLSVLAAIGWYAAHHWPQIQDFLQHSFDNGSVHHSITT